VKEANMQIHSCKSKFREDTIFGSRYGCFDKHPSTFTWSKYLY